MVTWALHAPVVFPRPEGRGECREVPDSRPQSRKLYRPARPRPALWALWCRRPKTRRWLHSAEEPRAAADQVGWRIAAPRLTMIQIRASRLTAHGHRTRPFRACLNIFLGQAHFRMFSTKGATASFKSASSQEQIRLRPAGRRPSTTPTPDAPRLYTAIADNELVGVRVCFSKKPGK